MAFIISPYNFAIAPVLLEHTDGQVAEANPVSFTHTMSGADLGSNDTGRLTVVAIGWNSGITCSSVVVDGVSGTLLAVASSDTYGHKSSIWIANTNGTGSSGDIVITFTGYTAASKNVDVYALHNASTSAHDTLVDNVNSGANCTGTINGEAGCAVIATTMSGHSYGYSTNSWTGVTEDSDRQSPQNYLVGSSASDVFAASFSGKTITVANSRLATDGSGSMCAVSISPA